MKPYVLYVHVLPNGKMYVGITCKSVNARWGSDGCGYKTQQLFWRAIQKYGWDNIKHIVLIENLSEEVAYECEKYLIAKYQTNNPEYGYNIASGGANGQLGVKRTTEQIKHISDGHKGKPLTDAQKRGLQYHYDSLRGVPRTDEVKKKISISNTGKKRNEEYLEYLSKRMKGHIPWNKGLPMSDETKEKLKQANIGKRLTDETRRKMVENNAHYWAGKHRSDETRRKISESLTGRPSSNRGLVRSEETKKKISESQKARLKDKDLSGKNAGFYGKHHTQEAKEKIRQASIERARKRKELNLQRGNTDNLENNNGDS